MMKQALKQITNIILSIYWYRLPIFVVYAFQIILLVDKVRSLSTGAMKIFCLLWTILVYLELITIGLNVFLIFFGNIIVCKFVLKLREIKTIALFSSISLWPINMTVCVLFGFISFLSKQWYETIFHHFIKIQMFCSYFSYYQKLYKNHKLKNLTYFLEYGNYICFIIFHI